MHKNVGRTRLGLNTVNKKLQNPHRKIDLQVKGAVHKLEVAGAALIQNLHLGHEAVQLEGPGGLVE